MADKADKENKPGTPGYQPPISSKLAGSHISHFMTRKVVFASPTTSCRLAIQMMLNHKISGLVVVDDSSSVLGVYSEMDAMLQGASQPLTASIRYSKPAVTVTSNTLFRDVLILMATKKIKRVVIVDDHKKLMGIVARRDLMRAIYEDSKPADP